MRKENCCSLKMLLRCYIYSLLKCVVVIQRFAPYPPPPLPPPPPEGNPFYQRYFEDYWKEHGKGFQPIAGSVPPTGMVPVALKAPAIAQILAKEVKEPAIGKKPS